MSSHLPEHEWITVERVALERQLALVTAERDSLTREREALVHERDQYKRRAEWLHQQLERLKDEAKTPREHVDPRQIQLVFEPFAQALLDAVAPDTSASSEPPEEPRKKEPKKRNVTPHGRRVLPEHLPVETLVLTPAPLADEAVQVGVEISWRLGYRRGGFYRLKVLRPVYVVPQATAATITDVEATHVKGTEPPPGASPTEAAAPADASSQQRPIAKAEVAADASAVLEGDVQDKTIVYAPAPDEVIPRGLPAPDLLAHVLVSKFADKLPFHRQEGIFARDRVAITRGTMCGWAQRAHELAHPIVDAMEEDGRAYAHVIATDATGVLVQANEKCKNGHFWVYVADRDHVIFRYTATHSGEEPKTFFKGFRGTVLSDASNVYDVLFGLPESPGEANCWSHARRYFYKAFESENRTEALIGIGFCNELFELERSWKKMPPSKRREERQKRSRPVVEMLKRWKDEHLESPHVADGSRLRKALNYLTNQWPALCTFLTNGRVPIHNNESERQLRSLVVGRANWLFVGSDETAPRTCTFVSLVASCQLHGIDTEGYLRDVFRVLPVWPKNRMLELAPKYWRETRALLNEAQMAKPLGPVTVPPARALRPTLVAPVSA
jgi:transposase